MRCYYAPSSIEECSVVASFPFHSYEEIQGKRLIYQLANYEFGFTPNSSKRQSPNALMERLRINKTDYSALSVKRLKPTTVKSLSAAFK